jgi:hypothetical protein
MSFLILVLVGSGEAKKQKKDEQVLVIYLLLKKMIFAGVSLARSS